MRPLWLLLGVIALIAAACGDDSGGGADAATAAAALAAAQGAQAGADAADAKAGSAQADADAADAKAGSAQADAAAAAAEAQAAAAAAATAQASADLAQATASGSAEAIAAAEAALADAQAAAEAASEQAAAAQAEAAAARTEAAAAQAEAAAAQAEAAAAQAALAAAQEQATADTAAADEPAAGGGELIIALTTQPNAIDGANAAERNAGNVSNQIFDPLVWINDDLEFEPALAESWTVSDDGLAYTFKLREDVVFHNGEPFNADSVVFSWEVQKTPDNQYFNYYERASEVNKIDEFTVQLVAPETQCTIPRPHVCHMVLCSSRLLH